jgi:anti-sigma B factor antagonist
MMDAVKVSSKEAEGILWIKIAEPEASIRISSKVHRQFEEYFALSVKNIAVDMSEVDFIDSSFLGVLVSAMKTAQQTGHKIALFAMRPNVRAIFDLTRLDKLISILSDEDAVKSSFKVHG